MTAYEIISIFLGILALLMWLTKPQSTAARQALSVLPFFFFSGQGLACSQTALCGFPSAILRKPPFGFAPIPFPRS